MSFSIDDEVQGLVVLSQRFALDIVFQHPKSTKFIDRSVASHLRICTSISADRVWKTSVYPSEPLLSHCAATIMWEAPKTMSSIFDRLTMKINNGMVDKGKSGELGSRVCTLLAKDICVRSNGVPPALSYSQSVPVILWLKTLFGESVVLTGRVAEDIEETFTGWEVNFSHWVCMGEQIGRQQAE